MPSERFLLIQMHELLMYLGKRGVVTILVMAQHGMMGAAMQTPVDVSFLADTVILLVRHFEAMGEVRQAISVVKKRRSGHERTIRELHLKSERASPSGRHYAIFRSAHGHSAVPGRRRPADQEGRRGVNGNARL